MSLSLAESLFAEPSLPPTRLYPSLSPPLKLSRQTQREQDVRHAGQQDPHRRLQGRSETPSRATKRKAPSNPAPPQLSPQQQHTLQKVYAQEKQQHHEYGITCPANEAEFPSHVRLFLIGKLAAAKTIETFVQGQDEWCADCLKKELAAARKDRQKDSNGRSASVKEAAAEPLSGAAASSTAASVPAPAKKIHVGPRMHDGSRVWPPLGWSPKQSLAGSSSASKEECTEVPEEGVARLVSRFSSKGRGSSGDLALELETQPAHKWSAFYGPARRVFDMGYGLPAADDPVSDEQYCKSGRFRAAARGSSYSSEGFRYTFSSTALPTSAASSPGCCSRFSSEKSLSVGMAGGAEQHRQRQQQQCSSRFLGSEALPTEGPSEASRENKHSGGEHGKAGALLTRLAAIGHRIRRASVNALRGSLLGPHPPADNPCRKEPTELVEAQAPS
ncbi:hypothetical protein Emag_001894 [Eimeria magna]